MASSEPLPAIVAFLRAALRGRPAPEVAIVCGSGLSGLSAAIAAPLVIPYSDIPHFPLPTVEGHGCELVFGALGGKSVVAQRGRFHGYEGHAPATTALAVRVFAALGCKVMVATNAAGGVNPVFSVGDIMVIHDHVSFPCLAGLHPLVGANDSRFGTRFPAVNGVYSAALRNAAAAAAASRGLSRYMRLGTYVHDSGPSYESPAEIHAMRVLGGDAVGMSTVPEVIVAAHCGMQVLGLSLITNQCLAPGDLRVPPSHEEVLAATEQRASDMQGLVADTVAAFDLAVLPVPQACAAFAMLAPPGSGGGGSSPGSAAKAALSAWSSLEWALVLVASSAPIAAFGVFVLPRLLRAPR